MVQQNAGRRRVSLSSMCTMTRDEARSASTQCASCVRERRRVLTPGSVQGGCNHRDEAFPVDFRWLARDVAPEATVAGVVI